MLCDLCGPNELIIDYCPCFRRDDNIISLLLKSDLYQRFCEEIQILCLDFSTLIFGLILRVAYSWQKKRAFLRIFAKKDEKVRKKTKKCEKALIFEMGPSCT